MDAEGGDYGSRGAIALVSLTGVAAVTRIALSLAPVAPVNTTTVGFGRLLFVLVVAALWGFVEALLVDSSHVVFQFLLFAADSNLDHRRPAKLSGDVRLPVMGRR